MAKSIHVFLLIMLVLHVIISAFATKFSSLNPSDECTINNYASSNSHAYPKVASRKPNRSGNCCVWDGVECGSDGHVIGLDLSSSFLYGTIYSNNSLLNLIHLQTLNLADNDFHFSRIPSAIGRFSQLANLNLSYSIFSGEVPKQISHLRNLVSLDLSRNQLKLESYFQSVVLNSHKTLRELFLSDTEIPASIGNLTYLNILDLSSCSFTGPIPPLATLSKLKYLKLTDVTFDRNNDCVWLGKFPNLSYLFLESTNLNCEIPSSIGNQTQLRELYLHDNGMSGQIPSSLTNLTHITALGLSYNEFTGSLPSLESFLNLTYLSISVNNFDIWKLPDWFGKLNKITFLALSNVNLYGEIPSSFFNLTQVQTLWLSGNQLKGQLSSSLLNFQNLESFFLYDNNFTVDFYLFLSFKKLEYLDLSGNNITMSLIYSHTNKTQPKFIDLRLISCNLKVFPEPLRFQHQLEYLYLDNNNIEGLIPGWMWNISKETLRVLSLSQNLVMGFEQYSPVAPWVSLLALDLSHNMLHGSIPVPPPTTKYFLVSNNKLTGKIPPSICDILSLKLLDLSFNNITGSIPSCLGKLSSRLILLNLGKNSLKGTIPNIFTNKTLLQKIDLSENELEGRVPRSLENCKSLRFLDLGHNFIDDMFPFWLGALSELQVLILRFNKFHGTIRIPSEIKVNFPKLRIIDLSYNSFSGDLPHQYFKEWLAMKGTKADATYMETNTWRFDGFSIQMINKGVKLDYVKIMNTFSATDLSCNMFTGKIPESIETLSGIQLLNLSNNQLSGVIPPSMGNLMRLESLDLSSNKLSGMIPQNLVKLNFLEFFNVSNNNLTGPIPQGKQFNTFSNNSYLGNQALCGDPLSLKCGASKGLDTPKVSFEEDNKSDFPNGIDWVVILIGVVSGLVIGFVCGDHLTTKYYM